MGAMNWNDLVTIAIPLASVVVGAVLWVTRLIGDLKDSLASFKQEVAKEYASMATLEKFEDRLMSAIDRLGDRIDKRLG
jgi:hypothetical protein